MRNSKDTWSAFGAALKLLASSTAGDKGENYCIMSA
jgi:hypothetical protein